MELIGGIDESLADLNTSKIVVILGDLREQFSGSHSDFNNGDLLVLFFLLLSDGNLFFEESDLLDEKLPHAVRGSIIRVDSISPDHRGEFFPDRIVVVLLLISERLDLNFTHIKKR